MDLIRVLLVPLFLLVVMGAAGRLLASPLLGGDTPGRWLRLPGNLLHEIAHALVVWATGYRVAAFRLAVFSPDRRGLVQPGTPWAPWAWEPALRFAAPPAPLLAGSAALVALGAWVGQPLDPGDWRLWAGALLAVSVAAEMTPSRVDLRVFAVPAAVAVAVLVAAGLGLEALLPEGYAAILSRVRGLADRLAHTLLVAAQVGGLGLVLAGPPLLLWRDRR